MTHEPRPTDEFSPAGRRTRRRPVPPAAFLLLALALLAPGRAEAGRLRAGAAKVDVTNAGAGPVSDPLYVKALVLADDQATAVIVTVDAVAIAEIGTIRNSYLATVRARLKDELSIDPRRVVVNASHCHGVVCDDIEERTVAAVKEAHRRLAPIRVGAGRGREDRISENRRLTLADGREVDVRHAYSLPPDEAVVKVGPIDPEIGVLKLEREDGKTLAAVYNFACHPIMGVPGKGNTADLSGFASRAIEDNLGEGAIALFLQGCGGDINPVLYKDVANPRDAEALGDRLGLSTLKALSGVRCRDVDGFTILDETIALPRSDLSRRIAAMEAEQRKLIESLQGTSLDLKTFLPLVVKYGLSPDHPSGPSHRYLLEKQLGRDDLLKLDAENRANMERYVANIRTMEELTRNQTNLALLRKHHERNQAADMKPIDAEVVGLRIGDFVLVTFPGELTVRIGLGLKEKSPHDLTFVAGYTNGYLYYAPTEAQARNLGAAQEDSDCLLAPEWGAIFDDAAMRLLDRL